MRRSEIRVCDEGSVHLETVRVSCSSGVHDGHGSGSADGRGSVPVELVGERWAVNARDLEVVKNENGLFISHRDGMFDQYTVHETSTDLPTEEENKDNCLRCVKWSVVMRRKEVTDINRDFAKQIMLPEVTSCTYPSPFADEVSDVRGVQSRILRRSTGCISIASSH